LTGYLAVSLALAGEDERHCQAEAMGALLCLDHSLGTDYAGAFLAADGPWARWPGSSRVSLEEQQGEMASLVAFARGADPGIRAPQIWPGLS
jgi:hypothetical protein